MNLILNKAVVSELIQGEFNTQRITKELSSILEGPIREAQFEAYHELETALGGPGASKTVADLIYNSLN